MGLISCLLLQGPLAFKIYRDLHAIHESEKNSSKQHKSANIHPDALLYALYCPPKSSWGRGCHNRDKFGCISTAKFLPSLTSFTPSFRFCFGRVSSMFSMWISSYTKPDSSKSFTKYYWKNKQTQKITAGISPTQQGHRVTEDKSQTLLLFWLQPWIMTRAFPGAHWTPELKPLMSNRVWSQEMGTALPQQPSLILISLQWRVPLDLWHKLEFFTLFYGDLPVACAHTSHFGLCSSSALPRDINIQNRKELTLLSFLL